jgi:hypothetical protein
MSQWYLVKGLSMVVVRVQGACVGFFPELELLYSRQLLHIKCLRFEFVAMLAST